MELPESKGTYVLIASLAQMTRLKIGSLGPHALAPGFYLYVGSALGAGGIQARLRHHLESTANPHWHIDYLLTAAKPVEVWYSASDRKLEHHWADLLERASQFRIPVPRFGSSDYHRTRSSHLFYRKRRPSFEWFRQRLRDEFEDVQAERHLIVEPD